MPKSLRSLSPSLLPAALFLSVVGLASSALAGAEDKCLVGTAPGVAGDAAQIRAVRLQIEAACPCATFDGRPGKTRGSYGKCAKEVIAAQVAASMLRPDCASTVRGFASRSTCGYDPAKQAVPCIRTTTSSGKIQCSVRETAKCTDGSSYTSAACATYTACIDAADTNDDLLLAAPGDTGACVPEPTTSDEWNDAVLYFAAVDRFLDGNPANNGAPTPSVLAAADYRGGDWASVRQKLDAGYFTDLGVNVLWLTVPVNNPSVSGLNPDGRLHGAYHGRWPEALDQMEERFGTRSELQDLVDAAHVLGIRVVLDWVMNHVHQSAPVYQQHPDWFWEDNIAGQSCVCGSPACPVDGANVTRCWTASYLPDFNYTVAEARDWSINALVSLVQSTGVDGLRLDGVPYVESAWITQLRSRLAADVEPVTGAHFLLLGDTRTQDPAARTTAIGPTKLDGQFNLPLRAQVIRSMLLGTDDMTVLETFLDDDDARHGTAPMGNLLGDDGLPRIVHFAQDIPLWSDAWADGKDRAWSNQPGLPSGTSAFQRVNNAYTLLFTRPGIPSILYGDEYAMPGGGDPDNRRMMQWSGYSAGQVLVNDHVKQLATIRAAHAALRKGSRTTLSATADTLVYRMSTPGDDVYVAINRSNFAQAVSGLPSGTLTDLLTGSPVTGPSPTLPARSSVVLVVP